MFTIIGADGKEYGPVPVDRVRDWIAGGRANSETRIKRLGETEWTTLGALPEFDLTPAPPTRAPGTPPPPPAAPVEGDAKTIADAILAHGRPLGVFACIGRGFDLWKANLLPLVGVTLVVMIAQMAAGMIPILGMFSGLVLNGVFYGGLYYYYLGRLRDEPREFADAFAGFTRAFVPLMLTNLLLVGLILLACLPFLIPFGIFVFQAVRAGSAGAGTPSPLVLLLCLPCVIPALYLGVAWAFAFLLVIDKGLGPWTALEVSRRIVTRQWFRTWAVLVLGGLVGALGVIGLFVGIFFTLPITFGALVAAYEDLFNPPQS